MTTSYLGEATGSACFTLLSAPTHSESRQSISAWELSLKRCALAENHGITISTFKAEITIRQNYSLRSPQIFAIIELPDLFAAKPMMKTTWSTWASHEQICK